MQAASCVLTSAWAATLPADRAEPALKPNQPNHSTPAPTRVSGSECGGIASPGQPRRRPRTIASARADAPEFISTTDPPAKSSTPICASQPVGEKTQWASGTYTTSDPQRGEGQEAAELHPVRAGAGQQRGRDHCRTSSGRRRTPSAGW